MLDIIKEKYKEIWLQDSVVRIIILTFFGGVILSIVSLNTFWSQILIIAYGTPPSPHQSDPYLFIWIGINILTTFSYSVITSISFSPKRLVSPFYMQITNCALIMIYSFVAYQRTPSIPMVVFTVDLTIGVFVYFSMLIMASWIITKGVKKLIGLSGTEDNLAKDTFTAKIDYTILRKSLKNRDFLKDHNFKVVEDNDIHLILKTRSDEDIRTVVVVRPFDSTDDDIPMSIVSLASYTVEYDLIVKSRRARKRINSLKRDIEDELKDNGVLDTESVTSENDAEDDAILTALKVTSSVLKSTPQRFLVTVSILIGISLALLIPLNQEKIHLNEYIGVLISIITTIVLLAVPALREHKKQSS